MITVLVPLAILIASNIAHVPIISLSGHEAEASASDSGNLGWAMCMGCLIVYDAESVTHVGCRARA